MNRVDVPSTTGQPSVTFTIDGVEFTVSERRQTAAALITLAGLDPKEHDLVRVVGGGQVKREFDDADEIQVTPGASYVTIFTGPTPVV